MKKTITKTSAELRIEAAELTRQLNTAILEDSYTAAKTAEDALKDVISDHNTQAMREDFAVLRSRKSPMLEAIEKLEVDTIALDRKEDKETGIVTYDLKPSKAYIDLLSFEEFCGGGIAHNPAWKHKIEKYNYLCALRVAKEIGDDVKTVAKRYAITPEAMGIDMGKTPTSNTQMLKGLQDIMDAVIYEDADGKNKYRVTSHDVAWLVNTLTKAGKTAQGLAYANTKTTRGLITRIMNRIVLDGSYTLEYTTKRDAEKAEESKKDEAKK